MSSEPSKAMVGAVPADDPNCATKPDEADVICDPADDETPGDQPCVTVIAAGLSTVRKA